MKHFKCANLIKYGLRYPANENEKLSPLNLEDGGKEKASNPTNLFTASKCVVLLPGDGSTDLSRHCVHTTL